MVLNSADVRKAYRALEMHITSQKYATTYSALLGFGCGGVSRYRYL